MKSGARSLLTVMLTSAIGVPAFAQDVPPPFEETTDVENSESRGVELGEDIYSGDDQYDQDDQGDVDEGNDQHETPTYDDFQSELSPHGRWVQTREYGVVWVPRVTVAGWRPYYYGDWIYTRHGWTFVSYDPWGAIPFHYGRWVFRGGLGWCWIPGYEWAPAWVSWRYGGDYVAWAPLGPTGISVSYYNSPSLWVAIDGPHFGRRHSYRHYIPTSRVNLVFRSTREYRTLRTGPTTDYVAHVSRRPVKTVHVVSRARPYRHGVTVIRRAPATTTTRVVRKSEPVRRNEPVRVVRQPQRQAPPPRRHDDRDRDRDDNGNHGVVKVKRHRR